MGSEPLFVTVGSLCLPGSIYVCLSEEKGPFPDPYPSDRSVFTQSISGDIRSVYMCASVFDTAVKVGVVVTGSSYGSTGGNVPGLWMWSHHSLLWFKPRP